MARNTGKFKVRADAEYKWTYISEGNENDYGSKTSINDEMLAFKNAFNSGMSLDDLYDYDSSTSRRKRDWRDYN